MKGKIRGLFVDPKVTDPNEVSVADILRARQARREELSELQREQSPERVAKPDREELQGWVARLVAEDKLPDREIARLCVISRRTLMRWKKQPRFQQKINEYLRLNKEQEEERMISERNQRIAEMVIQYNQLESIIRQRAKSPEMKDVPGGSTGLLRRGKGSFRQRPGLPKDFYYEVDTALLREMRRLETAIAKALGQWQVPQYHPEYYPVGSLRSADLPSGKQQKAALLIGDNTTSTQEIATVCGINRRTLARWKAQIGFRARVTELRTTIFS